MGGGLEFLSYLFHRFIRGNRRFGHEHQVPDQCCVIQLLLKDNMSDIVNPHHTQQYSIFINNREDISCRFRDHIYQLPQGCIRTDRIEVSFNQLINLHERKSSFIPVVCHQFPSLSQLYGIDRIGFKDPDGGIGYRSSDHQRHKQSISSCHFSNQEYSGQGCMDHSGKQSGHTHQGKITFRNIKSQLIAHFCKKQSGIGTEKKSRGKYSTHAPAAERDRCSHHFE